MHDRQIDGQKSIHLMLIDTVSLHQNFLLSIFNRSRENLLRKDGLTDRQIEL